VLRQDKRQFSYCKTV